MVTLRALREAHGLTLEQLADRIVIEGGRTTKASLSNLEVGRRKPSTRLRAAWARALKLQPVDIYQAEDLRALLESHDEPGERSA